jgi:hypothetical protein
VEELPVAGGIAPTLLALKGIPAGWDMRGRALTAVMEEAFLERYPPSLLETHDTAAWAGNRKIRARDPLAKEERLEQLRSLGYIR